MEFVRTMMRPAVKRWTLVIVAALLLGLGLVAVSTVTAPSAQAGFLGICEADTSFPAPDAANNGVAGQDLNKHLSGVVAGTYTYTPVSTDHTFTAVHLPLGGEDGIADRGRASPVEQYRGAGLTWHPWGHSCMDAGWVANVFVANLVFELVVVWPSKILGAMIQLGFGDGITTFLLDRIEPLVDSMHDHVFLQWVPLFIMLTMLTVIWKVARGRGRQGFGDVAWMVVVVALVGFLATEPGIVTAKRVNKAVQDFTLCVTMGMTGEGCGSSESSSFSVADAMVERFAADSWGAGVFGDRALEKAETVLTIKQRTVPPFRHTWENVQVPVQAIPARVVGEPTWSEVWRWTQTYTIAELRYMQAHPEAQCSMNPDQSPRLKELTDGGTGLLNNLNPSELCSYKWLVRAAVLSHFAETSPQHLLMMRGATPATMKAALTSMGVAPLALGIAIMAAIVLFYQLEFVFLIAAAPVVGLLSMRSRRIARKWGELVVMTAVKRAAVGVALGLVLWAANATKNALNKSLVFDPLNSIVVQNLLVLALMIAGFAMLKKISALLAESVEVNDPGTPGAETGKRLVNAGVGAAAGALAAGSGLRAVGALRGAIGAGGLGGGRMGMAWQAGTHIGQNVMLGDVRKDEERARMIDTARKIRAGFDNADAMEVNAEKIAVERVRDTEVGERLSEAQKAREEHRAAMNGARDKIVDSRRFMGAKLHDMARARQRLQEAYHQAQTDLEEFDENGRGQLYEEKLAEYRAQGMGVAEARAKAVADVTAERERLASTLEEAKAAYEDAHEAWQNSRTTHPVEHSRWVARVNRLEASLDSPNPEAEAAKMGLSGDELSAFFDLHRMRKELRGLQAGVDEAEVSFSHAVDEQVEQVRQEAAQERQRWQNAYDEAESRHGRGPWRGIWGNPDLYAD